MSSWRLRSAAALARLAVLSISWTAAAVAQPLATNAESDEVDIAEAVGRIIAAVLESSSERLFSVMETVELFDLGNEIDRLAGDPRLLNDSTAYKLSLLPFHIRYPIYRQIVRQMTRQDDLRSRRIHMVTPDAVRLITLRIDTLASEELAYGVRHSAVEQEVRRSLLGHFNAREMADLGFLILSQQPFFPESEEGWQDLKGRIADAGAAVALAGIGVGTAFDLAALTRSGSITSMGRDARLGWYAGFRRLGYRLRPQVRGGLTARLPGVEMAAGVSQWFRPSVLEPERALEVALREGWMNQLTRPLGWDLLFEGAVRRVLDAERGYRGEQMTARLGAFAKRDQIPRWKHLALRSSAELESDFGDQVRYAIGVGLEHAPTGVTTVLQASRSRALLRPLELADTRAGIFVTGTMEPFSQTFVESMRAQARMVADEWELIAALDARRAQAEQRLVLFGTSRLSGRDAALALAEIDRTLIEREERFARIAMLLAEYLDSRRAAYAMSRWDAGKDDLHGPLDPAILEGARGEVFIRLRAIAADVERSADRLQALGERDARIVAGLRALGPGASGSVLNEYQRERAALAVALRRESETVAVRLAAYEHYRESARRMLPRARRDTVLSQVDILRPSVVRRVLRMRTLTLR